ncbi:MAG: ComEC family competence protein [bacterium]|nr:ComEC family competence protein [bacterium]
MLQKLAQFCDESPCVSFVIFACFSFKEYFGEGAKTVLLRFYQSPFLYLTPLFILGVLFGELATFSLQWVFLASFFGTLLTFFILKRALVVLPVFAATIFLLGATIDQQVRHRDNELSEGIHSRVGVVVEVDQDEKTWKKHILRVESEQQNGKWVSMDQEVVVYNQQRLREGDVLVFRSDLNTIQNSGNPGEFDAKAYWYAKNITKMGFMGTEDYALVDFQAPNWLSEQFRRTRTYLSSLISNSLPEEEASLARALILGDKSKLSGETRESFGNAGAMHVLAISGLHVGIIMYLLFFLLKRANRWISRRTAVMITLLFLWAFAGVTGGSPSVLRATLMFSLLLLGQQWARSGSPMNTLFFSALILLLINPLLLFDIGFQLSYAAMLGIFIFFDRIKALVKIRNKWLLKAWEGTALGISAQMFTIPIVLYHFHQFPNYFWITNLGIMLLAGVILALGLIFFAFHFVPILNLFLAMLLGWSLFALLQFVDWVDRLPYGVAKGFELSPSAVALFLAVLFILVVFYQRKRVRYMAIAVMVIMVGSWQWDRFDAMRTTEMIIYNSNSPVISCKHNGEVHAFYLGKKKNADRLISAYQKVKPGVVQLDSLQNGITSVQMGDHLIRIVKSDDGIWIDDGKKTVYLRMRYRLPEQKPDAIIDMPYLENREGHYSLAGGAYRHQFN